ncbi:TspO/MBR family protein [Thiovibrio sp. JS02]
MRKIELLLIALFSCLVGSIEFWFAARGIADWYPALVKPPHAPGPWLLGVAWPVLSLLAAWSLVLFVDAARASASLGAGVRLYLMSGVAGIAFCYLFFVRHLLDLAVLAAVLLAGSIVLIIIIARPYSFRATLLLLPHFLWSAALTSLVHQLIRLNR